MVNFQASGKLSLSIAKTEMEMVMNQASGLMMSEINSFFSIVFQ
jgi:hypothetical protein